MVAVARSRTKCASSLAKRAIGLKVGKYGRAYRKYIKLDFHRKRTFSQVRSHIFMLTVNSHLKSTAAARVAPE